MNAFIDFNKAVDVGSENASIHNSVAWLFATCPDADYRNGDKAVELAKKSCELTDWKQASYLDTLAAAYAEKGEFEEAVKWQRTAINKGLKSDGAKGRLSLYHQGKPYRAER